jgi:hypothetical protein
MDTKRNSPNLSEGATNNHSLAADGDNNYTVTVLQIKYNSHCWNVLTQSGQRIGSFLTQGAAVQFAESQVMI